MNRPNNGILVDCDGERRFEVWPMALVQQAVDGLGLDARSVVSDMTQEGAVFLRSPEGGVDLHIDDDTPLRHVLMDGLKRAGATIAYDAAGDAMIEAGEMPWLDQGSRFADWPEVSAANAIEALEAEIERRRPAGPEGQGPSV